MLAAAAASRVSPSDWPGPIAAAAIAAALERTKARRSTAFSASDSLSLWLTQSPCPARTCDSTLAVVIPSSLGMTTSERGKKKPHCCARRRDNVCPDRVARERSDLDKAHRRGRRAPCVDRHGHNERDGSRRLRARLTVTDDRRDSRRTTSRSSTCPALRGDASKISSDESTT